MPNVYDTQEDDVTCGLGFVRERNGNMLYFTLEFSAAATIASAMRSSTTLLGTALPSDMRRYS